MAASNAGRKPRPRALKLIEGRHEGVDSGGRKIPQTPAFHRIPPDKPDHLSRYAGELWDRIVAELPRLGLLKELDGPSLEMACETYAVWREAKEKRMNLGLLGKNSQGVVVAPWLKVEHDSAREFRAWCAEYGLTPAAEMKLAGPSAGSSDPEANPFAGPQASSS